MDNEIIKALENIINEKIGCCAENCAFYDGKVHSCEQTIAKYSLDLINRQKAEIERLEHLTNTQNIMIDELNKACKNIKADAIKNFAEMLKQEDFDRCIDVVYDGSGEVKRVEIRRVLFNEQIDNLVKEMTESESEKNE